MKIHDIICEDTHLDEAAPPPLKKVRRVLLKRGWTMRQGSDHEIWTPPEGVTTTDGSPHIAIPRNVGSEKTIYQIISRAGIKKEKF